MANLMLKFFFTRKADARSVKAKLRANSILSQVIPQRGDNVLVVHVPNNRTEKSMAYFVSACAGVQRTLPYEVVTEGGPLT